MAAPMEKPPGARSYGTFVSGLNSLKSASIMCGFKSLWTRVNAFEYRILRGRAI